MQPPLQKRPAIQIEPSAPTDGHELNLWIVGDANGFQVLRFTDDFLKTQRGKAIHAESWGD